MERMCAGGPRDGQKVDCSAERLNVAAPVWSRDKITARVRRYRWLPFFKKTVTNYSLPTISGFKHGHYLLVDSGYVWMGYE